jgi:single-stranded-DNA-specific exonuclease
MPRQALGRKWQVAPWDETAALPLARSLSIPPLIAHLLVRRGCRTDAHARAFLDAPLAALHDPWLMAGMPAAVARVKAAIRLGDPILVCGDFDVDGVTGMALLVRGLARQGARVTYAVPQRLTHGYGLPRAIVDAAVAQGVRLLVTVDHGIGAHGPIARARQAGLDVVVCDHHLPSADLPPATAILNPRQPGCPYPFKELCGVGIAFKLLQALQGGSEAEGSREFLELVALGTIADLVPLTDENRILASHGLRLLADSSRPGLRALVQIAGLRVTPEGGMRAGQVAFGLAPRINAAGRLQDAGVAVRLLLTEDEAEARQLAQGLDRQNRERQDLEAGILEQALQAAEATHDLAQDRAVVLFSPAWHPGVLGIVAARVADRLRRPTALLTLIGEEARGSVRGAGAFHVADALARCTDLLAQHGGHRAAGGLSLPPDRLGAFRDRFLAIAAETLGADAAEPPLVAEAEVRLDELDETLLPLLPRLGPYGAGNPEPILIARNLQVMRTVRRVGRNHLKINVRQSPESGRVLEGIGFDLGHLVESLDRPTPPRIDLAFVPERNEWNGRAALQLRIIDLHIQPSASAPASRTP